MERSGTLVAGQRRAAAVLRKGGNLKKRTTKELSIFSDCRSLYPCAHQGNRKKRRRREHRFPPPAELGRLCVGMMCRFLRLFRSIVLTSYVLTTLFQPLLVLDPDTEPDAGDGVDGITKYHFAVFVEVLTPLGLLHELLHGLCVLEGLRDEIV